MSRIVCTRVACLRLPWFPIDVLLHDGLAAKDSPIAIVRGQGSLARLCDVAPTGHAMGLRRGMRPSRARALVAPRKQRGGFKTLEELKEVKGIGAAGLERMRPFLRLQGRTTAARP